MSFVALAPAGRSADGAAARRRINAVLRGPMMDLLATLVPEVAPVPRSRAFDVVMGDCDLLSRCFLAFRDNRQHFRFVLLDHRNRPVEGDNQVLACGRTVNQVVSMIVRSAAKRYFRRHLDPRPVDRPSAGGWVGWLDRLCDAPPPAISAADRLYRAIRAYLLHDWQVPIIPQYARMTPPAVRRLGAKILDFRSAAELAGYLDGSAGRPVAAPAAVPVPVEGRAALPGAAPVGDGRARLGEVLSDDGSHLRIEAVVSVLVRPEIMALTGSAGGEALRELCGRLRQTGAVTVRQLAVDFGLSAEQLVVFLAAAGRTVPRPVYVRLFGPGADPRLVHHLIAKARAAGLTPASPPAACYHVVEALLRR